MGLIKGTLLFFVVILLFVSLLLANIFLTMALSLQPEAVKPRISSLLINSDGSLNGFDNQVNLRNAVDENLEFMVKECQNKSEFRFANPELDIDLSIPCSNVAQGTDSILNYSVNKFVLDSYYKDYDCNFFDCFGKTNSPVFLVSNKAKIYWQGKFYLFLLVSLVLFLGLLFLTQNKNNAFIILGILMILSALPLFKIEVFLSPILKFMLGFINFSDNIANSLLPQISSIFFSKALIVFWIMFIIGIFFFLLGLTIKLLHFSFFLSKFTGTKAKESNKKDTKNIEKDVKTKNKRKSKKKSDDEDEE